MNDAIYRRLTMTVVLVWCLIPATNARAETIPPGDSFEVMSDWEPNAAIAKVAAERELHQAVTAWIATTRPSAQRCMSPENLQRLLENERVKRTLVWERKSRPYGTVVRAVMTAEIPAAAIDDWQMEIEQASQRSLRKIWLRITGTLATILVSLASVGFVDTRTRGYRRRLLGLLWAVVVLVTTTAIWTGF